MPVLPSIPWRFAALLGLAAAAAAQSGWGQLATATSPVRRGSHALAYDPVLGTTVLFGGYGGPTTSSFVVLADTWTWNGTSWSQRTPAHSPPARMGHALATGFGIGRIVLFGGSYPIGGIGQDLDDTWEYDGVDWTQRQPAQHPSARHRSRMTYDVSSGRIVLFGGTAGPFSTLVLGDTWHWNGTNWTQLAPPVSPSARWGHGLTPDLLHGRVVLWGGREVNIALDDTWIWNGSTWSLVATTAAPPAAYDLDLVYDVTRDVVVLAGGSQTWLFDGASWRTDPRPGGPPARGMAAVTHDLVRGRTILFGGTPAFFSYLDDTWEYAPGIVARWSPFGAGCAGSAGIPRLQPNGTSLPVVGATFVLELTQVPATGVAAIVFGFSATQWGAQALPASLATFGMPGCMLHVSPDVPFFVPIAAGRATLAWAVPNAASLIGTPFWNQGLAIDPGVNPAGAVVGNAGLGLIGPF